MQPTVLLVDDEPQIVRMLRRLLEREGFTVLDASSVATLHPLLDQRPELILLDLHLGCVSSLDLIRDVRGRSPDSELIMMTGFGSVDSAVACIRAGAFDYLEKPFQDEHRVVQTLHRALAHRELCKRNRELEGELDRRHVVSGIVSESAAMTRVVGHIDGLRQNQSNVLIEAESGTGKELIARAIHATSPRRDGPFVPVDCGALPEGIAEGELFGYERGAFTGAVRAAPGVFRAADGGTLFLDEVGELSPLLQSKLLRAIQEREVRPLGADAIVSVDVRIIAATNRDLAAEVKAGRFRSDLFYRLRVVSFVLPPLRERPEDVPLLAAHFLRVHRDRDDLIGFEPDAIEALMRQRWDGNVRELQNVIEAAVVLARGRRLTVADLGLEGGALRERHGSLPAGIPLSLAGYERACLVEALRQSGGSVERAASVLGVGRSTLYRKLGRHGLKASAYEPGRSGGDDPPPR